MARLLRDAHIPRSRRLIELVLLVVAVGIGSFSMYLIDPETAWDMGKNPWIQGTVVLGVCAHRASGASIPGALRRSVYSAARCGAQRNRAGDDFPHRQGSRHAEGPSGRVAAVLDGLLNDPLLRCAVLPAGSPSAA